MPNLISYHTIDWTTVPIDQLAKNYLRLLDGTDKLIEMRLVAWFWWNELETELPQLRELILRETVEAMDEEQARKPMTHAEYEATFAGLIETGAMIYGKKKARLELGLPVSLEDWRWLEEEQQA